MKKTSDKLTEIQSIIDATESYLKSQGYPVTKEGGNESHFGECTYLNCRLSVSGVKEIITFHVYNNKIQIYSEDDRHERIPHTTITRAEYHKIGELFDHYHREEYIRSTKLFKNFTIVKVNQELFASIEVKQKDVGSEKLAEVKSYCLQHDFLVTEYKEKANWITDFLSNVPTINEDKTYISSIQIRLNISNIPSLKDKAQKLNDLCSKFAL